MTPRTRKLLIIIGVLTLVVIGIIVIPRGLSLYYQTRGGQHIEYVLRSTEGLEELVCEPLSTTDDNGRNEVEMGIIDLERAIQFNRGNSQAYYYLGKANCLLGNPAEALKSYSQYTELRPSNPLGYIGLGFAYEALGDTNSAGEAWRTADVTVDDLQQAGDDYFKDEHFEQAIQWYERALLVDPKSAETWLNIGTAYDELQDNENALDAFMRAFEINPEISAIDYANSLASIKEYQSSIDILNGTLTEYKNSPLRLTWWRELGDLLIEIQNWVDAEQVYEQAIKEYQNDPDLHIALGWIYYEKGDGYQPAEEEFITAISLLETAGRGYAALAQLYVEEERFEDADLTFLKAIEKAPRHRWYYLDRGDAARAAGNLSYAIEIYLDAIERFPDFPRAYYQLAWAYQLVGNEEEAVKSIELALDLLDSPVDSYYARAGDIFRLSGLSNKAYEAYYQALSINPNNQSALDGLDLLGEN